jgi:uncharacterized protein (TIGR04255 family)
MTTLTNNLPDFEKPPVVEVALNVQFRKCVMLRSLQIAALHTRFMDSFPNAEEHNPLPAVVETLDEKAFTPKIEFELSNLPPVSRYFFVNATGTDLIQVQQDRFARNWRKVGTEETYPRYERIKQQFKIDLQTFCDFQQEKKLGSFIPTQCEVVYVNHIEAGAGWKGFSDAALVFTTQQLSYSDSFLIAPETIGFSESHIITNGDKPVGRLHILVEPAYQAATQKPIFKMTLIARGAPMGQGIDGVLNFFDTGRVWIVRGFASITQQSMHKIWGRKT